MVEDFKTEKEQILTQYIIHHEVSDAEVGELSERLDAALDRAAELHKAQRRKTGEAYIWHPVRTAMEVSRFGRIIDWAAIEAALLHDTLEDTSLSFAELAHEFPDAANLVLALTKIKDSRVHTYQKLFGYVLRDIRVLLVKIADRLDNLESLTVFKPDKQVRIATESAEMYANICRRLCMLDLAERLTEKIGPILTPEAFTSWEGARNEFQKSWTRPLKDLRGKLADLFPGDLSARIEFHWNRFIPDTQPSSEKLLTVRIITETSEDAYRALGRVHIAFRALPGTFIDTVTTPRKNGYRALETHVSYQNRIISFTIASRSADRFNRLGLLSMDISSPEFNLEYMDDLRDFLTNEDTDIQDFLRFHRPDAVQVSSPEGDIFSLEEGASALDFAFAVHEQLGLKAVSAVINGERVALNTLLRPGDRVEIKTSREPAADDRYLTWAHTRKALASLRRFIRKVEQDRAASTGRQWLLDAARAHGISDADAEEKAHGRATHDHLSLDDLYRKICLGAQDISDILGTSQREGPRKLPGTALLGRLRAREDLRRKVRRYVFDDPHIRFCPRCIPVEGDVIVGVPEGGRLLVHRLGCLAIPDTGRLPLTWEKNRELDLRDPGTVELEMLLRDGPGVLYAVLAPFKNFDIDIRNLRLPQEDDVQLNLVFHPGTARVLNRLLRALRKIHHIDQLRVLRVNTAENQRD